METVSDDDVRQAIQFREDLIARTRKLVDMTQTRDNVIGIVARELVNLQKDLRACGLRCVEKLVAWTLSHTEEEALEPAVFLWEGEEYLCKMLNDLNFVARELKENMRPHHSFELDDPLFVKGKLGGSASEHRAGLAASFVVLDSYARYEKRNPAIRSRGENLVPSSEGTRELKSAFASANYTKRRGVGDIYNVDPASPNSKTPSKGMRSTGLPVTKDTVVFRGKMLFQRGKVLGEGAYAKVYDCERQDGAIFAVKCFDFSLHSKHDDEDSLYTKLCYRREAEYLQTLTHPHIVKFEECVVHAGVPFLVMEKMSCTLLELQVDRTKEFTNTYDYSSVEQKAMDILVQVSNALSFMHEHHIVHRDIKPENILLIPSASGTVAKIGDLGSARHVAANFEERMKSDLTHYTGSRWYRAPELLGCGTDYGFEVDTWSLGCTLAEFITGEPLFVGDSEQAVLDVVLSYFYTNEFPPKMAETFLMRNLVVNEKLEKRSIINVLGSVSGLTQTIRSMVCLNRDNRFSAHDTFRDVSELQAENQKLLKVRNDDAEMAKSKKSYLYA